VIIRITRFFSFPRCYTHTRGIYVAHHPKMTHTLLNALKDDAGKGGHMCVRVRYFCIYQNYPVLLRKVPYIFLFVYNSYSALLLEVVVVVVVVVQRSSAYTTVWHI